MTEDEAFKIIKNLTIGEGALVQEAFDTLWRLSHPDHTDIVCRNHLTGRRFSVYDIPSTSICRSLQYHSYDCGDKKCAEWQGACRADLHKIYEECMEYEESKGDQWVFCQKPEDQEYISQLEAAGVI